MTGRLGNHRPRRENAGPHHNAFVDRALQRKTGTTGITHTGKAAQQGAFCLSRRYQVNITDVGCHRGHFGQATKHGMPVHID